MVEIVCLKEKIWKGVKRIRFRVHFLEHGVDTYRRLFPNA